MSERRHQVGEQVLYTPSPADGFSGIEVPAIIVDFDDYMASRATLAVFPRQGPPAQRVEAVEFSAERKPGTWNWRD